MLTHTLLMASHNHNDESNALCEQSEPKGLWRTDLRLPMPFYVYILRMNNGRLYVGHSNNPIRRHAEHEHGKGCRTTGIFGAGDIVHVEEHPDRASASARERQIKGWTHSKKMALAAGDSNALHALAKRHTP